MTRPPVSQFGIPDSANLNTLPHLMSESERAQEYRSEKIRIVTQPDHRHALRIQNEPPHLHGISSGSLPCAPTE